MSLTIAAPDRQTLGSELRARTAGRRVAIIHYWLFHMRGGEKVLEALCRLFPDADIFTHIYDADGVSETIRRHCVRTTFIQKLPLARKHYRHYLPLMPMALEELDLSAYDIVISSESGPAKGVIVRPDALHVCYCHTPMRYLWDQYHEYSASSGLLARLLMPWLTPGLRQWDVTSAARVDSFIANSSSVAQRIEKFWRRDARVVHPPIDLDAFGPSDAIGEHYLYVGELATYKRADLAIEACRALGRKLIVIGDGQDLRRLKRLAGPHVQFLGRVSASELRTHYAQCRALLFPGQEDFGMVPVEAMASGRPVIAYGRGGALDSVVDGVTGVFFREQTMEALVDAMTAFERNIAAFSPSRIRAHASKFGNGAFEAGVAQCLIDLLSEREMRASALSRRTAAGVEA